ncbi:MAG: M1 family peptidase, partial [Clostridia bacterium]|nr:M1 family peptidase [Clostridia bacterium]
PETALGVAADSLAYYSETFGDYAYPRYTLVETDFPYGGMEYSGLAMIASDLRPSELPLAVAHETAHQWWYGKVGSNQFECSWQDEGLAEYSTALFLGEHPEYGCTYEQAVAQSEKSYRAFFSVYSQLNGEADTKMNRPLTSFTGDYEYRNIAYDKGVILFSRLRSVLGDRKFFGGLKEYDKKYAGKIASPSDLIACFTAAGGNAEGVFTSFTEGLCVI